MNARKRFAQHFLIDRRIIADIISHIAPFPGEDMVEIGPGDGALTAGLLNAGAALTAIEIDRDLATRLRARFGAQLNLIVNDVLRENLSSLIKDNTRVAGNLPYNISAPLLLRLINCRAREMWLMLQEEVVARLCAPPGAANYGRLTVSVRLFYEAEKMIVVSPQAFMPPPTVHSAVVRLRRRLDVPPFSVLLPDMVLAAFQSRRKILRNGLAAFDVDWRRADIAPERRPQTLTPEEFARLSLYLKMR